MNEITNNINQLREAIELTQLAKQDPGLQEVVSHGPSHDDLMLGILGILQDMSQQIEQNTRKCEQNANKPARFRFKSDRPQ